MYGANIRMRANVFRVRKAKLMLKYWRPTIAGVAEAVQKNDLHTH
jgi:hypothetical protein